MNKENIEAMADILQELGVTATPEQIEQIVKDYDAHVQMLDEMSANQCAGYNPECVECKRLKNELSDITKQRDVYHNSVMRRRNATRVWLEGDMVMYE